MKQHTRRLFSLLLALVMALSLAVPAFADEDEAPEKELHWVHLDGSENGFTASADALKNDDPGHGNGTEYDLSREDAVLFFIWNNRTNKREGYVVPTAGDGLVVEKLPKEAIASGAKQSQYYVTLRMTKFQDSEVTANGLSFHVTAKLGDFGFYSAETPSADTILVNEVEAAKLTGSALYFCAPYMGTEEAAERDAISTVEKDPNTVDFNKLYDIENVKEGLWKITINDAGKIQLKNGGGIWINLQFEVKQSDGNTRQDGRSINVMGEEQAPQLWFIHLNDDWDNEGQFFFIGEDVWAECQTAQVHTGDYAKCGIFGTIKEGQEPFTEKGFNWNAFTPVDVKDLKTPAGLTVESISGQAKKGEKLAKYFVKVSVAENGKEYKVTSGDYVITVDSGLPDIGVYTAPTASFDSWLGEWGFGFHPAYADQPYYIISTAAVDDGLNNRKLTDAKLTAKDLPEDCGNALMDLAKVNDNVYKLSFKKGASLKTDSFHVELDLTWTDFMGNTWTDEHCYLGNFDPRAVITVSGAALTSAYYDPKPFAEVADKVSTSVSINVGEKKEVYLYPSGMRQGEFIYVAWDTEDAVCFRSDNEALTISYDENDPSKFTLTATKPGTYEIWIGGENWDYENMKLYHADGKEYTAAEYQKFQEAVPFYANNDGKFYVIVDDQEVPFEEAYPGEKYELKSLGLEDFGWQHLTVTVTGEAKTFTDVKPTDWFAAAVQYACGRGLMNGTDKGFEPVREVYNTEMLQILWNMSGNAKVDTAVSAAAGQWYAGAVNWAASVKLIDGDAFTGQKLITRGEVRELMAAYGKLVGKDYSNLFNGNESGDLMLDKTLTRCELAQMLTNAKA